MESLDIEKKDSDLPSPTFLLAAMFLACYFVGMCGYIYLRQEVSSVATPLIALKGFQRIHLAAGESRSVSFTLSRSQLSLLDAKLRTVVEPGTFRVMIGRSSKDILLRGKLLVK